MRGEPPLAHDRSAQGEEEHRHGIEDLQANAQQRGEEEEEEHPIDQAFPGAPRDAQVGEQTEEVEKQEDRTDYGQDTHEEIREEGCHPCHGHKCDSQHQDRTSW